MSSGPPSSKGHRHPVEVISHWVWLYFRFPLGSARSRVQVIIDADTRLVVASARPAPGNKDDARACLQKGDGLHHAVQAVATPCTTSP